MNPFLFPDDFRHQDIPDSDIHHVFDPIYMIVIVLGMYMAAIIDNFDINTVGSRQKLRFISKQNNFQTEKVYNFAMPTSE